jgi:E3 ubiquitin-protein ligase TRIP12
VQIILNVLPGKGVPKQVLQTGKSPGIAGGVAVQFATSVQPLLMQCLVEHIGFEQNIIVALAITLQLHNIAVPSEVINVICGLTQRPPLAPAILFFAQCVSDQCVVSRSGLLRLLRSVQPSSNKWFSSTLARLSRKGTGPDVEAFQVAKMKTLQQMLVAIRDQKVGAFQLVQDGFFERATALVKGNEKVSPALFEPLVASLFELLLCLPIEQVRDPFGGSVDDFKNCNIGVQLVQGKRHIAYSYLPIESFAGAEAIWNYNTNHITNDMLTAAYHDAGPVAEICPLPQQLGELSCAELGSYHRIYQTGNYKFLTFASSGTKFTSRDFMVRHFEPGERVVFHVTEAPATDLYVEMTAYVVPTTNIDAKLLPVLKLLQAIHARMPGMPLSVPRFENRLSSGLKSPFLVMTLASPEVQIIANFPFLFSFELRQFVFQVTATDIWSGLSSFTKRFMGRKLADHHNHIKCHVRRENIFEDGVRLIHTVGVTPLHFELIFQGEEGIGLGPTQEFFSLFSHELSLVKRGMWRNDWGNKSPYVVNPQGLFPLFSADPKLFFILGVLCAKALQMGFIVPLPFNLAFFMMLKGEPVTIDEVDQQLAESLKSVDGLEGLPFVLPGTATELKKGGKSIVVSKANFEEYKKLILEFVCGAKVKPIITQFKKGFCNLFQPNCWGLLSAAELSALISGIDGSDLTLAELVQHVEVSHGYSDGCPQIKMLFDILMEMQARDRALFFKFVTGSDRLPIGGIGSLKPKLTVAKKGV